MAMRYFTCWATLILASVTLATAQEAKPEVKHATAPQTSPASGKEMFLSYCSACHGKDAKGDGPAAAALKATPADLTLLAKLNGGKYPADKVTSILRGETNLYRMAIRRCRCGAAFSGV
jgi:mono/diheme cytochrome c family protein